MRLYPSSLFSHATLKDCGEIVTGSTPSKSNAEFWGGKVPFVTPAQLGFRDPITTANEFVTLDGAERGRMLPEGAVLVCCIGSLGKTGVAGVPLITNQQINAIIFDPNQVEARYGYYAARKLTHLLEHFAPSTTVKIIKKSSFAKMEIPLPSLAEQKRIAKILDTADAMLAKRREALAQLDDLLKSTFLDMFGDPVANPMGWEAAQLGNIMRVRRGGSPRPINKYLGGTINWIKIGDATCSDDDIHITSCADKITEDGLNKTTLLEPGSFVFANSGVSLGFARILKIRGAIHDGWLAFDNYDQNLLDKMFFLKALNGITDHFRRIAPSGTQPNLNIGIMKSFKLILPPLPLQTKFAAIVNSVEQQKSRMKNHLSELDTLFASLQQRAFNGDL